MRNTIYSIKHALIKGAAAMMAAVICTTTLAGCGGSGNSGGPLCNMYGQVVGVTNSKIALEDYEGMGFAIPSQTVKKSVDDIIRYGYVKGRVKIGITGEVDTYGDNGELGIKIITIDEDSEIGSAGAEKGDFITKVDDKKIGGFGDIFEILEGFKEGDKVKITLYRPSTDKTYDVNIKVKTDK